MVVEKVHGEKVLALLAVYFLRVNVPYQAKRSPIQNLVVLR